MDAKQLKEAFEKHGIRRVKVGGFDVDGVLRGKYVSLDKFWGALEDALGFCDVIFGWDAADVLYDNAQRHRLAHRLPRHARAHRPVDVPRPPVGAGHRGVPPRLRRPTDGAPHPACPRGLLEDASSRARARSATTADVRPPSSSSSSSRRRPRRSTRRASAASSRCRPGMFGYSWVREGQNADLCHAILDDMERFGIPIEGLHTETGPGVYEVAIQYDEALRVGRQGGALQDGDEAARVAPRATRSRSWPSGTTSCPGSSGHLHQSLWKERQRTPSTTPAAPHKLSARRAALPRRPGRAHAGAHGAHLADRQQLQALRARACGRRSPRAGASRTARAPSAPSRGAPKSTRLEYRQTAADINPYIAIATTLAAGPLGHRAAKRAAAAGRGRRVGARRPRARCRARCARRPRCLAGASTRAAILGEGFVDHYVRTRDWECRQYERAVTEWELGRYFEAI